MSRALFFRSNKHTLKKLTITVRNDRPSNAHLQMGNEIDDDEDDDYKESSESAQDDDYEVCNSHCLEYN